MKVNLKEENSMIKMALMYALNISIKEVSKKERRWASEYLSKDRAKTLEKAR